MAEPSPRSARRGLGRGLSALLGDEPGLTGNPMDVDVRQIAVGDIHPQPGQPRRRIDEAALEALATSIATHGLMQPVVVRRRAQGGFELIAGERRWRAATRAGLVTLPALVREADERARLELALVENMVREDLSPIEVAHAVAVLVEDFGQSHTQIAVHLGRSRPAVSNLMRLLELPDEVQQMVDTGALSEGHGRAILMADGAKARKRLADEAVEKRWSVRELERRARTSAPGVSRETPAAPESPLTDAALDVFTAALGARTRVAAGRGGTVSVRLDFADDGALRAAVERLRAVAP